MTQTTGKYTVGFSNFSFLENGYSAVPERVVDPNKHLVGACFYPSNAKGRTHSRPRWMQQYGYSKGFLSFVLGPMKRSKKLFRKYAVTLFEPLIGFVAYMLGRSFALPAFKGLPISTSSYPHPVVLVSHGVGGNRMVHSCLCCELASQGFCVFAIEHADGSASTAKIAGNPARWLYFQGANGEGMKDAPKGFAATLRGRLDMERMACLGHSFGGGPSCALPAESGYFKCGIGMDPYWPSLPADRPIFHGFKSPAPLLLIGSQSWNDPDVKSYLRSASERETQVFQSAQRNSGGGGLISMVIRGIGHASFSDADFLFGKLVPKTVLSTSPIQTMAPQLCISLLQEVILTFLKAHLPLTAEQRADINPKGPRRHHPHPQESQPDNPVEGAGANIKDSVLQATEEASKDALASSNAAPGSESPVKEGRAAASSGQHHESHLETEGGNGVAPKVNAKEEDIYTSILGAENVFSIKVIT